MIISSSRRVESCRAVPCRIFLPFSYKLIPSVPPRSLLLRSFPIPCWSINFTLIGFYGRLGLLTSRPGEEASSSLSTRSRCIFIRRFYGGERVRLVLRSRRYFQSRLGFCQPSHRLSRRFPSRNENVSGDLARDVLASGFTKWPGVDRSSSLGRSTRSKEIIRTDEISRYTRGDVAMLQTQATCFYELLRSNLD